MSGLAGVRAQTRQRTGGRQRAESRQRNLHRDVQARRGALDGAGNRSRAGRELARRSRCARADRLVLTRSGSGAVGQAAAVLAGDVEDHRLAAPENPPMAAIDGDPKTGWGVADGARMRSPFLALAIRRAAAHAGRFVDHGAAAGRIRKCGAPRSAGSAWRFPTANIRGPIRTMPRSKERRQAEEDAPVHRGLPADVSKALRTAGDARQAHGRAEEALRLDFEWCDARAAAAY